MRYMRIWCNGVLARDTKEEKREVEEILKNDYGFDPDSWLMVCDQDISVYFSIYLQLVRKSNYGDLLTEDIALFSFTIDIVEEEDGNEIVTDAFVLPYYIKKQCDDPRHGMLNFMAYDRKNALYSRDFKIEYKFTLISIE